MQIEGFTVDEAAGAFRAYLLNEERCKDWILRKIHPGGPHCPECGDPVAPGKPTESFWSGDRRVCCKKCGKYFSARTNTVLAGMAFSFAELYLLACLLGFNVPVREIAEILGVCDDTVGDWRERFSLFDDYASRGQGRAAEGSEPRLFDAGPLTI